MRFFLASVTVCFALATSAAAQSGAGPEAAPARPGVDTAFARAQHLRHGINASSWFSQSRDYSAFHTDRYTDADDIALIAKLGFDNVRLSIDGEALEQSFRSAQWGGKDDFVKRLDKAVDTILADGLAVQIDVHPSDEFKHKLRSGSDDVDQFVELWRELAAHYANRNPERVFFEILNEPEVDDSYRWAGIQTRVAAAIREVAPRNTIIATGASWSDIRDLLRLEPLADGNVIYNFHFYDPHEFTHQGATWGVPWWSETHSIPYPVPSDVLSPAGMQPLLAQVPDLADRFELENYFLDDWNAQHIQALIDEAAAWGRENHVPLICNEFGVFRDHSDPASRANWIRDTRTALEADGIGWAMWDYRGNFGVVTKQDGQATLVDEAVMKALGLSAK
ncbi:MAG: cellulase family glycosylhydrolase [Terracidiphilus sp.]